jgi:REP element-mobilizing transposase RayT
MPKMVKGNSDSRPDNKKEHLPHLDLANHYQFITFRTHDSQDQYLKKLTKQNLENSQQQLTIDQYLDLSHNGAYLNGKVLLLLSQYIKAGDRTWYELVAYCIMPNHVHLLIKPLDKLPKVMQRLKGGSAKLINELMNKNGRLWASDYYDKLIRDENHFVVVYKYIKNNAVALCEAKASPPRFYGIYENSSTEPGL